MEIIYSPICLCGFVYLGVSFHLLKLYDLVLSETDWATDQISVVIPLSPVSHHVDFF